MTGNVAATTVLRGRKMIEPIADGVFSEPISEFHLRSQSIKVLLVEDSTVLAERLGESLAEHPHFDIIGTVDNEAEAIRTISRQRVDLLILDLQLRQGTGFGVMRALAGLSRAPRIIVLTNHDLPQYGTAALKWGAVAFLDKARHFPVLPAILNEKMRALGG